VPARQFEPRDRKRIAAGLKADLLLIEGDIRDSLSILETIPQHNEILYGFCSLLTLLLHFIWLFFYKPIGVDSQ
jgi:hypothetical protein